MSAHFLKIIRRQISSSADAAAFLRSKKTSEKLATTTSAAEKLRNLASEQANPSKDPKLNSFYSQSQGTGRAQVNNAAGKKPKLTSMYTKDSHID